MPAQDQEQIIEILSEASVRLSLWQAGRTETVVKSARLAIKELVADLEAKAVKKAEAGRRPS
jgi:hypothetical protein